MSCHNLLPHLDPLSLTFALSSFDYPLSWEDWECHGLPWTSSWTRIERVIFQGGNLYEKTVLGPRTTLFRGPDERPLGDGSLQITYDLRGLDMDNPGLRRTGWLEDMLTDVVFDLPLAPNHPILIQTSSEQTQTHVDRELRNMGVDKAGSAYRDRVEISRETEEEGEKVMEEMEDWRRRGRDRVEGRVAVAESDNESESQSE
jgi:hypothetical protein